MSRPFAAATAVAALAATAGGVLVAERLLARRGAAGPAGFATVRTSVAVLAGREAAWKVLADVEGQVRWMHDAKAIRIETPGPPRAGTRARADVRIFGIPAADAVEISAWEPPRRFAIRHVGAFKGEGEFRLEESGDERTLVTWEERLVAPVLPNLAALALAPLLRRIFQADLERFAVLVLEEESTPAEGVKAALG